MLDIERMSARDLEAQIKEMGRALQMKIKHEKLQKLKGDFRLADLFDEAKDAFFQGNYESARSKSSEIWRSLNVNAPIVAESDWRKHLKDYESVGSVIKMPIEWGFKKHTIGGKEVNREIELERGLCYTIGARPGTGKTSVACNLAYHYAKRKAESGNKVLFLTNEMKPGQVWVKFRQIDMVRTTAARRPFMLVKNYVRYPDKFEAEFAAMGSMCDELSKNFAMYSVRRMTADDIVMLMSEAKNIFGKHPDIVIVDYLQRIPRVIGSKDPREGTIKTYQAFSEAALDMDSVIFILSQMNKDGGYKESEVAEEEAGIAWEISRTEGTEGAKLPSIDWRIKKSRISSYLSVRTGFDDLSGTVLDEI